MDKRDRIINMIREMMVANAPGESGGFSAKSPAAGPTAGFDPLMGIGTFRRTRSGSYDLRVPKQYKRWLSSMGKFL